jgi:hypothetical protein
LIWSAPRTLYQQIPTLESELLCLVLWEKSSSDISEIEIPIIGEIGRPDYRDRNLAVFITPITGKLMRHQFSERHSMPIAWDIA